MIKLGLINQDGLSDVLSASNDFEVVFDCEGKDARKNLSEHDVDIVVTELVMAGEDGFALMEKFPDKKFIVASELKSEVFITRAIEKGAKFYLLKPLVFEVLSQRLKECVQPQHNLAAKQKVIRPKSVSEKTLDERISNIFVSVGIPAHIKGYQFLREGIKLAVDNPPIINAITKSLYPTIAKKFDTTSSKVERAIRHAIEVAWNRGKIENINALFGLKVYSTSDKPTNGEFIALLADKMLLECAY